MKNMDPKIAAGVTAAIVLLALLIVYQTAFAGKNDAPPPIMAGGPGAAKVTMPTGGSGGAPALSTSMPGANPGVNPGASSMPGGGMTLPTPPR